MRSPSSSESARVTVILPVRRRLVAAHRHRRTLLVRGGGRAARHRRLFLLLGRHRILPAAVERRDLGGGRLAGALGDLAARFLFLAPRLFLGSRLASSRRASCASSSSARRASSSARWRASSARALLFLAPAVGLDDAACAARLVVGLCASCTARARPARSSAVSVRGIDQAARRLTGVAAAGAVPAAERLARPGVGACQLLAGPGTTRLFADLDGDRLRAPVREALADLSRLDRPAQSRRPPDGSRLSGRFCSCSLLSVMSFRYHYLVAAGDCRPSPSILVHFSGARDSRPAAPLEQRVAGAAGPAQLPHARRGRGRTPRPIRRRVSTSTSGKSRPSPAHLPRPLSRAVGRREQHRRLAAAQRRAHPLEPGDRQAGAPRQAEQVAATLAPAAHRSGRRGRGGTVTGRRAASRESALATAVPLYRGAASTTNPVRAAARRHRARPHRPVRRRTAAARPSADSPVTMQRRNGPVSSSSVFSAGRTVAGPSGSGRRRGCAALGALTSWGERGRPVAATLLSGALAASASSNQCARAAMMSALASSIFSLAPPLSERRAFDQLVAGEIGKIVERLDAVLAERHQHARGQPLERRQLVVDAELAVARLVFAHRAVRARCARALLQLARDVARRSPRSRRDPRARR